MTSLLERLIDNETGEIDRLALLGIARIKAEQDYGAPNFPPAYLRIAMQTCLDRAHSMRLGWLRDHGRSSDEPTTMFTSYVDTNE